MKTKATTDFPEIEWEREEIVDNHGHTKEYNCSGVSQDGREWIGTWLEDNGEFTDIVDIQEGDYYGD